MRRHLFLLCMFLLLPAIGVTADIAVSPTGSGSEDGSDWDNTAGWDTLTFTRGNTYFLADGTYATKALNTADSGTDSIYIKKATVAAHGPATGWADAMGDGQAALTSLSITTSYWNVDGVSGSGSDNTSYGIRMSPATECTGSDGEYKAVSAPASTGADSVSNLTLAHIAFIGCGLVGTDGMVAFESIPTVSGSSFTIRNNYFYGFHNNMHLHATTYSEINDNYFANNWSSGDNHGEQLSLDLGTSLNKIYNNTFKDSSVYVIGFHHQGATNDNNSIYNNIIDGGSTTATIGNAHSADVDSIWRLYIYNNSILNIVSASYGLIFINTITDGTKKSYAKNNIFYNITGAAGATLNTTNLENDYNAYFDCADNTVETNGVYGAGSPFVDDANGDYSIGAGSAVVNKGVTLGTPYNMDYLGVSRPQGAAYDIGAFEYDAGVTDNPSVSTPSSIAGSFR